MQAFEDLIVRDSGFVCVCVCVQAFEDLIV